MKKYPSFSTAVLAGLLAWAGTTVLAQTSPMGDLPTAEQIAKFNPAVIPTPTRPSQISMHDSFVALAKKGDIDMLFLGDSITDWWRSNGKEVFDKNYGDKKVANFGIAGETTQQVLWRLQNGEGAGFQPKLVMLMIGTNNLASTNTDGQIAEGVTAVVGELRKDFPAAKILLLGIFPRGGAGEMVRVRVANINQMIAKLNDLDHVFYLDIGNKFLDEKGDFLPDAFLSDRLHPAAKGYAIWADAVREPLANLMKLAQTPSSK